MKAKGNQLKLTRLYDAPVKLVWDAWTDPVKAAKWWGPRGFTITTHSKDLRPGGRWNYTMHGPDGTDYPNSTLYHEVEEYKKLVYDHGGFEDRPPLFQVCVIFTESNSQTLMEMTMTLESPEFAKEMAKFIRQASGNSTWDRLGEFLEDNKPFIINRAFETNTAILFSNWKKCTQPDDFTSPIAQLELIPNQRISYSQDFTNSNDKWPKTILTVVTFASEGENQSRVTLHICPHKDATAKEREEFQEKKSEMTSAWNLCFDEFEKILDS